MSDFISLLDHRWDFDEASGAILDKVGSADSAAPQGVPTFNGNSVTYDGVDDAHSFTNAIDVSGDWTHYIVAKAVEDPDGVVIIYYDGDDSPTTFIQNSWDDLNKVNNFRMAVGTVTNDVVAGRLLNQTETTVLFLAYKKDTNNVDFVIKSDDPVAPFDLSGFFENTGADPASTILRMARNAVNSKFFNIEVFEMGSIDGTAKSIEDMQDTAANLLFPIADGSSVHLLTLYS